MAESQLDTHVGEVPMTTPLATLPPSIRVLGLDPGTLHTGVAVVEWHNGAVRLLTHGVIHEKGTDPIRRILKIKAKLQRIAEDWKPDALAIERYTYAGRDTTQQEAMCWLVGACLDVLCVMHAPGFSARVALYTVAQWRQQLVGRGGRGTPGKSDAQRILHLRLGYAFREAGLHACDAAGVALVLLDTLAQQRTAGAHT